MYKNYIFIIALLSFAGNSAIFGASEPASPFKAADFRPASILQQLLTVETIPNKVRAVKTDLHNKTTENISQELETIAKEAKVKVSALRHLLESFVSESSKTLYSLALKNESLTAEIARLQVPASMPQIDHHQESAHQQQIRLLTSEVAAKTIAMAELTRKNMDLEYANETLNGNIRRLQTRDLHQTSLWKKQAQTNTAAITELTQQNNSHANEIAKLKRSRGIVAVGATLIGIAVGATVAGVTVFLNIRK